MAQSNLDRPTFRGNSVCVNWFLFRTSIFLFSSILFVVVSLFVMLVCLGTLTTVAPFSCPSRPPSSGAVTKYLSISLHSPERGTPPSTTRYTGVPLPLSASASCFWSLGGEWCCRRFLVRGCYWRTCFCTGLYRPSDFGRRLSPPTRTLVLRWSRGTRCACFARALVVGRRQRSGAS